MAIITQTKSQTTNNAYLNIYPDQFKTEKEKEDETYIKDTMDYFSNRAYVEYLQNANTFAKNYDLIKGIIRREDFYMDDDVEVRSFVDTLTKKLDLPKFVKHYSIMSTPINELVGEVSKRPDTYRVKAFDDDSKAEELQYKTQLLQDFVLNNAKVKIIEQVQEQGLELSDEEIQEQAFEKVKEELDNYTSVAEKWANRMLTAAKMEFNIKEKAEDAFRDLIISNREYFLVYEDNSKVGFNVEEVNPKNVWRLSTPDKKYSSDPSGRAQGAYAAGTVHVMELSEIIELFPFLTQEEIDHLRTSLQDYGIPNVRESNLFTNDVGTDSIKYDTYDPLMLQARMLAESQMMADDDGLESLIGLTNNVSTFGYKYVVVRAYWISKKKVGKLQYEDEFGNIQSTLVDENYKSGDVPTQISLDWGWVNQWYEGVKIGPDVYHMRPYRLLDYCPIIGMNYEIKNTQGSSVVDMMKPFQVIYNVCMNQLFSLLKKEVGNVASVNIRRIPRVKDGDEQDAIDIWEMEARERGIMFDDDSPENTKAPVTNTSVARNVDLTRTQEIQSRYNLAVQMKNECWELVGMSKQRLGSVSASESATGTNAAITQSYTQTEPLYIAHEYVMGQLYQAIIDAAQYVECTKPSSTLSFITGEGENAFIQVNGTDLKFRDLKVFPTNRPEDTQMFNELRALAQPILQNGGTIYDVIELYSTKSIREMRKTFKDLHNRQMEQQEHAQQIEQQKLEQSFQQHERTLQQAYQIEKEKMLNENNENMLDRISEERIAIIKATGFGQVGAEDNNSNNVPDVLEASRLANDQVNKSNEYNLKMMEINQRIKEANDKFKLEQEKLKVERENMRNDLQIARENRKGRSSSNNKKKK